MFFKKDLEPKFDFANFKVHKFNNRIRPKNKSQITFITCFSEFSCEMLGVHYCIPKILKKNNLPYVIVVGWLGRDFLYSHLVDEFWELKEEYQPLREFSNAFLNTSKFVKKLESTLADYGKVISSIYFGNIVLTNKCFDCQHLWVSDQYLNVCPKCNSLNINRSFIADPVYHRKEYAPLKPISLLKKENIQKYLKPNSVGIFARGRKKWGRNLTPEFYDWLINLLLSKGYNPIWIGEKQSIQSCSNPNIINFSDTEESLDLECTLALISELKFTIQFFTASTRLAACVKTPYILFESTDEIIGKGQEGARLALTTKLNNMKKLVFCNYFNFAQEKELSRELVIKSIEDLENKDFRTLVALTNNPDDDCKKIIEKTKTWWE